MSRKLGAVFLVFLIAQLCAGGTAFQVNSNHRLPKVVQKHHHTNAMTPFRCKSMPSPCNTPILRRGIQLFAASKDDPEPEMKNSLKLYNDDSFGLTAFIAGIGTKDAAFAAVFISLTVVAAGATRVGVLPMDWKYPKYVDRRVPGVIAALALLGTPLVSGLLEANFAVEPADPIARPAQLAICSFSMVTAFFDIRWRDGFEPKE